MSVDADTPAELLVARPWPSASAMAGWLVLAAACSVCVGLIAWWLQRYFAPAFLFPLMIGLVVGAVLCGGLRWLGVAHRGVVLVVAVIAALAAVATIHLASYRAELAHADAMPAEYLLAARLFPELAERGYQPPESFAQYLQQQAQFGRALGTYRARGVWVWLWWGIDALLAVIGSLIVVGPALRRPFCGHCRSWYRTIRAGRLSGTTVAEVAKLGGLPPLPQEAAEYRLEGCRGGCGPSRIELSWDGAPRAVAWLSAEQRRQLATQLDAAASS